MTLYGGICMDKLSILAAIYFLTGAIFNLSGIYTLNINKKASANRLYFLIMVVLSLWAWTFKSMIIAKTALDAVYFWRISVFAWGTFYSFLYHLIDVMKNGEHKRNYRFYLMVYLPSLINIIIYAVLVDPNLLAKKMIMTDYGWNAVNVLGSISPYFVLYYCVFFIVGLFKTRDWLVASNNPFFKKRLRNIVVVFIVGFFIGLISDTPVPIKPLFPSIGIIILLFPFGLIFDNIRKQKIMTKSIVINTSSIINDKLMHSIIILNGYCYVVAAFATYAVDFYFFNGSNQDSIIFALSIYSIGMIHFIFADRLKSLDFQYSLLTFSCILFVTIIKLRYEQVAGQITFSIVFYLLILTVIFDKKVYSYIAYAFIVLTQFIAWYIEPNLDNTINQLIIFIVTLICTILILFINRTFSQRVRKNANHIAKQAFVADASYKLLSTNSIDETEKINDLLYDSLITFGAERVYLVTLDDISKTVVINEQIFKDKLEKLNIKDEELRNKVSHESYLLINNLLNDNNTIYIDTREKIPDYAINIKILLHKLNLQSFVAAPIMTNNSLSGAVLYVYPKELINETDIQYITVIANFIGEFKHKVLYEKTLYQNANFDLITNLANRNYFGSLVEKRIQDPLTSIVAIIFIDIDNFKDINDAFGHHIGDEVLKKVAGILTEVLDNEGDISRFGGDEFVIVHDYIGNKQDAQHFVEKVYRVFKEPIEILQYDFRISMSIGISIYPNDGETINELIKNADLAMYEAKQQGKNRFAFCSDTAKKQSIENILYTNKLFDALKNDEFLLYFQPQLSTHDESIVGAEVLLRWNSPDFGLVPPFKFISILEQTGLIIPVGAWIIEKTLDIQKQFKEEGKKLFRLSVNLSSVQFQDENLIDTITGNLIKHQIDPQLLEIEITESLAVNDPENSLEKLYKIKAIGCPIAIDDFGVEFSSLNRLQKMPIDRLKIDKSFIDGIGVEEKKETIIDIIIKLANSLKLHSIAEGVEEQSQLDFLRKHGCEEIQGYYYAKPMPLNEFINYVDAHNK